MANCNCPKGHRSYVEARKFHDPGMRPERGDIYSQAERLRAAGKHQAAERLIATAQGKRR